MNKKNVSNPFINLKFLESLQDSLFLFVKFTYLFQNIYCRESHLIQYHQLQNIIVSQKKKKKNQEIRKKQSNEEENEKNRRRRNDVSWFHRRLDERIHIVGPPWWISSIRPTLHP